MTEVKKEGIGKRKVSLIICAVLVVILAIFNIWLFMRTVSLQSQVNTLEATNNNLQNQVSSLEADKSKLEMDKSNLESQVSSLQSQVDSLQNEVDSLKPRSYTFVDNDTLIYQLAKSKTYGPFFVSHAGIMLVRVETPFLGGYAGPIYAEIKVSLSGGQQYISQEGTLRLVRTDPADRIKTALFPVASHTYPLTGLSVTITYPTEGTYVTNTEPVQLSVTITYVEG